MSTGSQPLKLNYAKARQKSKTKNELQSQQKIAIEGDSSSDIFSHLNQDNLNYIKKELKHKKASQSQQKTKPQTLMIDKKSDPTQTKQDAKKIKIQEKYKNTDQVTQKDSILEQTIKDTSLHDSVITESIQSSRVQESQKQQPHDKNKDKHSFQGLQPPPSTYTAKHQKGESHSLVFQRNNKSNFSPQPLLKNPIIPAKSNFLDYELKSQTSNNQMGQSTISVEKQTSQNLSVNYQGSQFIDYLQSYIEELNSTEQKKFIKSTYKNVKQEEQDSGKVEEVKNFKKYKEKLNNLQKIQNQMQEQGESYGPISVAKNKDVKNILNQSRQGNQRKSFILNSIQIQSPQDNEQRTTRDFQKQLDSQVQELKKQLQKEKYYCTKLALQLEKYKQNESKNQKEIYLLQKTIEILKVQIENVKELYQNEAEQTQKILTFFQIQKQKDQNLKKKQKENEIRQAKSYRQKFNIQPQLNFRRPIKSFNESQRLRNSTYANQFQNFMKFKQTQNQYDSLNPKFYNHLMDQFQKGQEAYNNGKQTVRGQYSRNNSNIWHSEKNLNPQQNAQSLSKYSKNYPKVPDNQQSLEQEKLYQRNRYSRQIHKNKNSKLKNPTNSSSEDEIQKQKTSLEKLKRQYELFKAQTQNSKYDNKKFNKKNSSLAHQISPKQFSRIYVK